MFFQGGPMPDVRFMRQNMRSEDDDKEEDSSNFVIVIMAAGEGKRMRSDKPKVLHEFNGKVMIVKILETISLLNVSRVYVITGRHHDKIKEEIEKSRLRINVQYVRQREPLGTGDAIKSCLPELTNNDSVLILNGDMPCINGEMLVRFVNDCNEAGIITVNLENPTGYGRIIMNNRKEFRGIREEKDCTDEERLIKKVNTGIYYLHAMILKTYLPKITNENRQQEYYLTDIFEKIFECEDLDVNVYTVKEEEKRYVMGVNTPEELTYLEELERRR